MKTKLKQCFITIMEVLQIIPVSKKVAICKCRDDTEVMSGYWILKMLNEGGSGGQMKNNKILQRQATKSYLIKCDIKLYSPSVLINWKEKWTENIRK